MKVKERHSINKDYYISFKINEIWWKNYVAEKCLYVCIGDCDETLQINKINIFYILWITRLIIIMTMLEAFNMGSKKHTLQQTVVGNEM